MTTMVQTCDEWCIMPNESIMIWYASSKQLPCPKLIRPYIPGWAATARSASVRPPRNARSVIFVGSPGNPAVYLVCWY